MTEIENDICSSNNKFKTLAESSIDAVIICNKSANMIYVNPKALEMFGYKEEEMLGKSDIILVSERYKSRHIEGLEHLNKTGMANISGKILPMTAVKKGGQEFPIEMSISFWKEDGENFYTAIIRDITERVELEQYRDDLTNMIVHDMKNPISGLLVTIELFKDGLIGPVSDKQKEFLESANVSARNLLNLTLNLLDVKKIEEKKLTLEKSIFGPNELLDGMKWYLPYLAFIKKEFKANYDPGIKIFADKNILSRIIENLVSNSIKHTGSNGKVMLNIIQQQNNILFEVVDNGEGIPKEYLANIFDKFFKVKGRKLGSALDSGLGLTFCKLAVEAHGGNIGVESEIGKGTKFYFSLPTR